MQLLERILVGMSVRTKWDELRAYVLRGEMDGQPVIRIALATLPDERTPTRLDWERLSRGSRDELDRRIATLAALRERLTGCIGCGCLSLQRCALFNPADEAAALGGGAHYLERDRL